MIIQPRKFNLRKTITVLAVLLVASYFYYQRPAPLRLWKITGRTMGTTYTVKLVDHTCDLSAIEDLKTEIDALLNEINLQMSTYLPDSEISIFNRTPSTEPFPVADGFAMVGERAQQICRDTGGAFDPTLNHLIDLWGFGPTGPQAAPTDEELLEQKKLTGCDQFRVEGNALSKSHPAVTLNLNAIAPGWAVDVVADHLMSRGITNYFVEIGGEIMAHGISEKVRPWRVGIDRPVEGAAPGEVFDLIVELDGVALATSGNYRNFQIGADGRKYAHILDPRTGRPTTTPLASVTVIAHDCTTADALATALFVMGADEGLRWVDARDGLEAAFIEHAEDGTLRTSFSHGFESHLVK